MPYFSIVTAIRYDTNRNAFNFRMLALLCSLSLSLWTRERHNGGPCEGASLKVFKQLKNHVNSSEETFDQRYCEVNTFEPSGPVSNVILYIGGEGDGLGAGGLSGHVASLASDLQATVFTLEHRYFGTSFPADSSTENYAKYLSLGEALGDLANFAKEMKSNNATLADSKWLLVGGSYPGMLSALARQEYPDVFHAALSSSGVVMATDDYKDFDLQIAVSLGHECAAVARQARRALVQLVDEGKYEWVAQQFGLGDLPEFDFSFVIGEIFTIAPQYGQRAQLCDPLVDTLKTRADPLEALAKFSREYFVPKICGGNVSATYSSAVMKKQSGMTENVAPRSWLWMCCNELAYWQTSPGRLSIRPHNLTQQYFKDQCTDVFGEEHNTPKVNDVNTKYGGLDQKGTRTFFSTGSQDPWTWACVTEDSGVKEGQVAHTITGLEVGHCKDLHAETEDDPADVKRTRKYQRALFKKWMAEE